MLYLNNIFILLFQLILFIVYIYIERQKNIYKYIHRGTLIYVIYDEFMHLSYYVIIMFLFLVYTKYFLIGLVASVLIDIDHIIDAKSFNIKKLVSQKTRPITHSYTYIILFSILIQIIFKDIFLTLFVFIGFFLHLIRDMLDNNSIAFFPFKLKINLKYNTYIILSIILIIIFNLIYFYCQINKV